MPLTWCHTASTERGGCAGHGVHRLTYNKGREHPHVSASNGTPSSARRFYGGKVDECSLALEGLEEFQAHDEDMTYYTRV